MVQTSTWCAESVGYEQPRARAGGDGADEQEQYAAHLFPCERNAAGIILALSALPTLESGIMSARQRRRPWVMQATALYDYDPEELDELPLIEGQQVRVLQVQDDGWWLGYVADDPERVGLFPSNYVRQEHDAPSPQQQQRIIQQQMQQIVVWPNDADDEEDEVDEEQDDERQQHQRRTRQRDQRQQQTTYQPPQANDRYRNVPHRHENNDGGDNDDEEEEEALETAAPAQQRMVSVLQLKRSLADAERASDAARAARLQAERERIQQQHRRPLPRTDRGAEDEEEEDDDGTERREQNEPGAYRGGQQQRRRAIPDEEDDDDEAFQYNQRRNVDGDGDDNDEQDQEEEDEEKEEQTARHELEGDGSFSVPVIQGSRMKEVISAYQAHQESSDEQEEDEEQAFAASRIAHEYRKHRMHQQSKQQERSFAERQDAAALAIHRWMLRTSSEQRMRNQGSLERGQDARHEREQQEYTEGAAAARIQSWMRQVLVHFRWKEHVERERIAILKCKRVKMLQLEQEARQKAEEEQRHQQEIEEQERQQQEREREEFERQQRHLQQRQQRQAASDLHQREPPTEEKARKKIMKKEAVDLVKVLVKKQLDEKLREHDEKMGELQRLVTTLQDVIRKQSEMILQGSIEPLPELQIAHKSSKFMQQLGKQQSSSIPVKQSTQSPSAIAFLASSSASTCPVAPAKESFIPKPPSRLSLPQLGNNVVKPVKPSGIKPSRNSTDFQSTKLPVLANAHQSSSIPVKQ